MSWIEAHFVLDVSFFFLYDLISGTVFCAVDYLSPFVLAFGICFSC